MNRQDGPPSTMAATLQPKGSRAHSPTPSTRSAQSQQSQQKSPGHNSALHKRSILDKVTGRHKNEKQDKSQMQSTSTASLQSTAKTRDDKKSILSRPLKGKSDANGHANKKEHSILPFKRKDTVADTKSSKDPNGHTGGSGLYHLDTDITRMEGIVDHKQPMTPPADTDQIYSGGAPGDQQSRREPVRNEETGAWDAPDSWAVKRVADENVGRLKELDDEGNVAKDEDRGPMYFMRIFRADSTFAVISASLNTTAAELISMMAKKTFLQDELDNYQIVMRKHDTSRQLEPGERPLVLQKRLLEMVGYAPNDRLEDLGREDHGYLCRFTFLPAKMSGYSSLERDPGFNKMQRFNHIDLSGRNLITIPITLYQKATEIITLNLSRNLKLDIPKDFVQSCTQLREIKYNSNEAWKLPSSLSLATKLTMLDVSNNRLEQLEHAEMDRLSGLVSLKLSNNKLSSIPPNFGQYYALRSLNLSSNSLTEFPNALRSLSTLVDLDVSFN